MLILVTELSMLGRSGNYRIDRSQQESNDLLKAINVLVDSNKSLSYRF